jgi:6-phosphogluconolactonase
MLMDEKNLRNLIKPLDDRRDLAVPGDYQTTLQFCVEHFLFTAQKAIASHGRFAVALSGGSTPKAIYQKLLDPIYQKKIDWTQVLLFWSDERNVSPDSPESNYRLAMEAAFKYLPIRPENIHRMKAEADIVENALAYQNLIHSVLKGSPFDLVMLGMGEDGHTASLFPHTEGLHAQDRLVIANYIPEKNTWRMTLTFECINASNAISLYVLGKSKAAMLKHLLTAPYQPEALPAQRVGSAQNKALWIADQEAFSIII